MGASKDGTMNEYNDCLKALRELARAIRSNGLSAAERNEIAGSITIIATRLERLAPEPQTSWALPGDKLVGIPG